MEKQKICIIFMFLFAPKPTYFHMLDYHPVQDLLHFGLIKMINVY